MILDSTSNPVSTAASFIAVPQPTVEDPKEDLDYLPSPGRVTVLRAAVSQHYVKDDVVDIAKGDTYVEEVFNVHAKVLRVGEQMIGGMAPWFEEGQRVTIEPSLFREIKLAEDLSVYLGPFSGVTGVFKARRPAEAGPED